MTDRFEQLYAEAAVGRAEVPWDRPAPGAALVDWAAGRHGDGRSAVVVGCGYGRDAEFVASLGYATTGFDLSPTAIAAARARHRASAVDYTVADPFALPAEWSAAFDLVVESHNVQSLPPERHAADDGGGPPPAPPWPLAEGELDHFAVGGLALESVERSAIDGVGRWRAVLQHR